MSGERFVLRTTGGPFDGQTRMVNADQHPWPFPDEIEMIPDVRYRKVRESQLPPQPDGSFLARGAEYEYIDPAPEPERESRAPGQGGPES